MRDDDLPLLSWQRPGCVILLFPLHKQVGKVRDVARKLSAKTTDRHCDHYRSQVTEALQRRLDRLGIAQGPQDQIIGSFWRAVEAEALKRNFRERDQDGGAA